MKRVSFAEFEAAKLEVIKGKEYREYTDTDQYGRNHKTYCCEDGGTFWEVTERGVTEFWSTAHPESRYYEEAKEIPDSRKQAVQKLKNLAYWFMGEMLKEEERGEQEKAEFEKAKAENPENLVMMVSTAGNNASVMKDCMKEAREAAEFLRDMENDVEAWQLAGINAMFDQCSRESIVPYDLPAAVKGLLCMQYR